MTQKSDKVKEISLGLLGAGEMPDGVLSDCVTWQNGESVLVGQAAVIASARKIAHRSVTIEEVVTHGKAAAVSGRLLSATGPKLFCHMIKFTSTSAQEIASIVSFEHQLKGETHDQRRA